MALLLFICLTVLLFVLSCLGVDLVCITGWISMRFVVHSSRRQGLTQMGDSCFALPEDFIVVGSEGYGADRSVDAQMAASYVNELRAEINYLVDSHYATTGGPVDCLSDEERFANDEEMCQLGEYEVLIGEYQHAEEARECARRGIVSCCCVHGTVFDRWMSEASDNGEVVSDEVWDWTYEVTVNPHCFYTTHSIKELNTVLHPGLDSGSVTIGGVPVDNASGQY